MTLREDVNWYGLLFGLLRASHEHCQIDYSLRKPLKMGMEDACSLT